jgi:two-component system chemotaxis response regulator CheY
MASADLGMPVLIVDDYKTMLRIIRNLLKQLGFEDIDEASDGHQGLERMRDRLYGLVISDLNMQPMDGMDFLKQVRADLRLTEIPFVMIAADGKPERVSAAEDAGVSGYLVKPFNVATLKTELVPLIGTL